MLLSRVFIESIMINTVPRRVCFVPQATGLEILQQIQSEQLEIGKHELTTLAELQSHGIPVYGMFDSVLNFRNRSLNEMVEHDRLFNEKDRLFAQIRHEGHGRCATLVCHIIGVSLPLSMQNRVPFGMYHSPPS